MTIITVKIIIFEININNELLPKIKIDNQIIHQTV